MNMQQFTGWVTRLLNALPWRRAQRPPKLQMRARVTSSSTANRFMFPDEEAVRRQKAETNPRCSTLPEDAPATLEPPTTSQPLLLPAPSAPEASTAPLLALPAPSTPGAADASPPEVSGGIIQADPESRLAFARYLFRRGVFNEGFTGESVPAQYRDRASQDEG
jgi:hypothetical protein